MSAEDVKASYADQPWGKYLLAKGWEPYDTESAARSIAGLAADDIAGLLAACDVVINTGGMVTMPSRTADAINQLEVVVKGTRHATGQ